MNKKARTRLIVATVVIAAAFAAGVVYMVSREGAYYRQVSDLSRQDNGKTVRWPAGARTAPSATTPPACTSPCRTSPASRTR